METLLKWFRETQSKIPSERLLPSEGRSYFYWNLLIFIWLYQIWLVNGWSYKGLSSLFGLDDAPGKDSLLTTTNTINCRTQCPYFVFTKPTNTYYGRFNMLQLTTKICNNFIWKVCSESILFCIWFYKFFWGARNKPSRIFVFSVRLVTWLTIGD